MKKLLLLLLLISFLSTAKAQYVTIPDSNFRVYLESNFPSCFNSNGMMDTTCTGILDTTYLNCSFLNIASIDGIQYFKSLNYLLCNNNSIASISSLPDSIWFLICTSNPLTYLPKLPNELVELDCDSTNITCLPVLPTFLQHLTFDSSKIHCLPLANSINGYFGTNYGMSYLFSNCDNTATNTNNCSPHPSVTGKVFYDNNKNGVWDNNEPFYSGKEISLSNSTVNYKTNTTDSGLFFLRTDSLGNFSLHLSSPPNYFTAISNPTLIDFTNPNNAFVQDIALQPFAGNYDSATINGTGFFSTDQTHLPPPNIMQTIDWLEGGMTINYKNVGTSTLVAPVITIYYDSSLMKYSTSTNQSLINTGTSLVLSDSDMVPGENRSFTIYFFDSSSTYFQSPPIGMFTNTATISANGIIDSGIILNQEYGLVPLKLISFNGLAAPNNTTLLYWSTANEANTKSFIIEQSIDGLHFTDITSINAKGFGNNNYTAVVPSNASIIYYRLKMIDNNGSYTYSVIVTIKSKAALSSGIEVFPNPASKWINIRTANNALLNKPIKIINSNGATVKNILLKQGLQKINVSDLPAGFYFIQTQFTVKKIVISR